MHKITGTSLPLCRSRLSETMFGQKLTARRIFGNKSAFLGVATVIAAFL